MSVARLISQAHNSETRQRYEDADGSVFVSTGRRGASRRSTSKLLFAHLLGPDKGGVS